MAVPVKYQQWVDYHYPTPESAKHQCAQATALMIKEFPELRRVCGMYTLSLLSPPVQHWWCETIYRDVVDPTWRQFLNPFIGEYSGIKHRLTDKRRYEEINPPPIGKCLECGEMTFTDPQFCNSSCSEAFRRSLVG